MPGRPPVSTPFVGRTEELAALEDAFDAAADGLVVTLVGGDPGVGKTTLARSFTLTLRERCVPVHWGSCAEVGGAPAFWPWVQVLRAIGPGVLESARAALDARADEPFAAYEAVHDVLRRHGADRRVLVLDDLHTADLASLGLLRFLLATAADLPLLVIGTHRLHELRTDRARDVALSALAVAGRRIEPRSLGLDDVRSMLDGPAGAAGSTGGAGSSAGSASGEDAAVLAADVLARSGGNALYVEQLVDAVRRDGAAGLARIPDGIRAAVRARMEPLPEASRSLLALASVLAPGFRIDVLAAVAGTDEATVRDALAPALAAGLLTSTGDGLTFTHVLVRDTLGEELEASERAGAHGAAAAALVARDPSVPPAVVAQHLVDAGDRADPADAARWAETAAGAARRVSAHREAARWAEEAARQWARAGDHDRQGDVLALAIGDRVTVGDGSAAIDLSTALADLARRSGSARLLATAALARGAVFEPSQEVEGPPLLREALAHPDLGGEGGRRAELLAGLAGLLGIPSVDGQRRDAAGAFAAVAELEDLAATGDPRTQGQLASARLNVFSGPRHHHDRLRWAVEHRDQLPPGPQVLARIQQLYWATSLAFEAGDLHEVDRVLREWEAVADASDSSFWKWRAAMARASLLHAQGRLDASEHHAVARADLVATLHPDMAFRVVAGLLFSIRRDQGRLHEVSGLGEANLGVLAVVPAADRGDVVVARRLLAGVVARAERTGPDDLYWLCLLTLVAQPAEVLGDAARCRWVADALDPYVDQCVMWGRSYVFGGPVSETVGIARRGAGQPEEAAAAFRLALAWADRSGALGFGARARVGLASVLGPSDPERAELLAEARPTAVRLGLARVVDQVDALVGSTPGDDGLADGDPPPSATEPVRARVRTLGRFEVVPPGATEPSRWSSRKARDALKILICRRGRAVPREELIDLLWPDVDLAAGRNRLSVVLSMVRTALDPERLLPGDPLRSDRQSVSLDPDLVATDVEQFLGAAQAGLGVGSAGGPERGRLLDAAALADEGPFLAEDPYVDFARALRSQVERTHREVVAALARWAEAEGDAIRAATWWARARELDPDDR